jgi:hypothetical protein
MSDCVNVTEVTTAAGWIVGLAIVALIAAGWRKPARATADPLRARRPHRASAGVELAALESPFAGPTRWWRRLWALIASSTLTVLVGAVIASAIGFGMAWMVITLTNMLKR